MKTSRFGYEKYGVIPRIVAGIIGIPIATATIHFTGDILGFNAMGADSLANTVTVSLLLLFWPGIDRVIDK